MNPHLTARLRIGLLLIIAIVIETALANDVRIAGVAPDLLLLIAICAGLTGGAEAGAWVGFFAGLLTDMFLTTPLGLSALTYCLIAASVGALRGAFLPESRALTPVVAFVATAAGVIIFVGVGDMLGQSQLLGGGRSWLVRVVLLESAWAAVLSIPVAWLYARIAKGSVGWERLGPPRSAPIRGSDLKAVR